MGGGAPAASREQLEAQYASQLEQLQGMGFTNVAENLAGMLYFGLETPLILDATHPSCAWSISET